jgi:trimeric autotransporter adhesin
MLSGILCFAHSSLSSKRSRNLDRDRSGVPTQHGAKSAVKIALGWVLCVLVMTLSVSAQVRSGTITGLVTDPKGAAIVGAEVTVTETSTHVFYTTKTTGAGIYSIPYLQSGTYNVSVTKAGFQDVIVNGLGVNPSETVNQDVQLHVGTVTSVIEVQAAAETLQTESSTITAGLSTHEMEAVPNITMNPLYYLTLQNNVVPRLETATSQTIQSAGVGVAGRAELSAIGVNGGRAFENDIQLDGLPDTGDGFNEMTIVPNIEGLQQSQVISNNFTAEYGHGQSVMEMSTRSGTNEYHGQVNFLFRNQVMNANTWGNKLQSIPRQDFQRSNAGAALGGPILRNRLFFFSSYHYETENQGQGNVETVPTDLERVGNFSQTMQPNAQGQAVPAQLFNPYSVTQIGPNLYQRAPIPSAIITPALLPEGPAAFNAALAMFNNYPSPNRTPSDPYNDNNYVSSTINTLRLQTLNNRIDFKLGKHSIYGTGGYYWTTNGDPFDLQPDTSTSGGSNNPTASFNNYPSITSDRNFYAQIGDTIVMSPSFFIDARYGMMRTHSIAFGGLPSGFNQYSAFGISSGTQALFAKPGSAPVVWPQWFGYSGAGGGTFYSPLSNGGFANKEERQIAHSMNGSATKIVRNLTFKFGAEYRVQLANYTDFEEGTASLNFCCSGDPGGNYGFEYVNSTGGTTQQDNDPQLGGINGAKSFLGQGVWFIRPGANLKPAYAAKYFAVYSQNDWRVKPGLTINLGLRWDVAPGLTERHNRLAGYDFTATNPFGTVGMLSFPGTGGYSRNMWDTEYSDLQPRVGAAYQITKSLVAHGGFGITYLPSNTGYFSSPNDYGEASFAPGNEALPFGANPQGVPTTELTDPAPLVPAVGPNPNAPQNYGITEAYFDRHLRNQQAYQANFFLEKSFGASSQWLVSVGWSDAISHHLSTRNFAFESLQSVPTSVLGLWKSQYIANNGSGDPSQTSVPNPYQPTSGPLLPFTNALANATIQQLIPYLPYPLLYGGGLNGSTGFANYNAGLVHAVYHGASGLTMMFNYTWSKELDFVSTATEDGQGVNPDGNISSTPDLIDPHNNVNYGADDTPNAFSAVVTYQSPFGAKGKYALSNPVGRAIAGGWNLGTVFQMRDGTPAILNMGGDGALTGRIDSNKIYPYVLPKSYQKMYNGSTSVTLPCGQTITPGAYYRLKYDQCAFQGETLTTPNGSIVPNIYWVGNSPQTNGNIRTSGYTNVDFNISRSVPIWERFSLQIGADFNNLFNHPEFQGDNSGGLGTMNLANSPSTGLVPGIGNSSTFGSGYLNTYDARQIVLHAVLQF